MKKRLFLFFALAAVVGSGVFAQTHFVSAEISILGGGARYEYVITPYITINGYAYYNFLPTPFISETFSYEHRVFGAGVAGRWYPVGRRFFMELGLGYNSFTSKRRDTYSSSNGYTYYDYDVDVTDEFSGFSIAPGFGWTIDVGKPGGFFISPGIKIPFTMTSGPTDMGLGKGVYPSVVGYFGMGYAF
jgi:hypothetical protein